MCNIMHHPSGLSDVAEPCPRALASWGRDQHRHLSLSPTRQSAHVPLFEQSWSQVRPGSSAACSCTVATCFSSDVTLRSWIFSVQQKYLRLSEIVFLSTSRVRTMSQTEWTVGSMLNSWGLASRIPYISSSNSWFCTCRLRTKLSTLSRGTSSW